MVVCYRIATEAGSPTRIFAIAPGLTNTLIVPLGIIFNLAGTSVRGFTALVFADFALCHVSRAPYLIVHRSLRRVVPLPCDTVIPD